MSSNNIKETWFHNKWRPTIAWLYAIINVFDFIIMPIITMIFSAKTGTEYVQWEPLTLKGGGLFHVSFMAILGVTSWTRGQEKIKRLEKNQSDDLYAS